MVLGPGRRIFWCFRWKSSVRMKPSFVSGLQVLVGALALLVSAPFLSSWVRSTRPTILDLNLWDPAFVSPIPGWPSLLQAAFGVFPAPGHGPPGFSLPVLSPVSSGVLALVLPYSGNGLWPSWLQPTFFCPLSGYWPTWPELLITNVWTPSGLQAQRATRAPHWASHPCPLEGSSLGCAAQVIPVA